MEHHARCFRRGGPARVRGETRFAGLRNATLSQLALRAYAPTPEDQLIAAERWTRHALAFAAALASLGAVERALVEELHLGDRPIAIERAAQALGVSSAKARALETRALMRLFSACEPGGGPVLFAGRRLRATVSSARAVSTRDSDEPRSAEADDARIDTEEPAFPATPHWHTG